MICDLNDPFVPCESDDVLITLDASTQPAIEQFLSQLPGMLSEMNTDADVETCTGTAIEMAHQVIANIGGRIILLATSLPSYGSGRLVNRENQRLINTAQEHTLLTLPSSIESYYRTLGVKLNKSADAAFVYLLSLIGICVCVPGIRSVLTLWSCQLTLPLSTTPSSSICAV